MLIRKSIATINFIYHGGEAMSPKELSYIEDALNHEQFLKNQCDEAMKSLSDQQLISCVQELKQSHQQIFDSLYQLV